MLITKKHLLWPNLALYVQFSQRALFKKATPTNYRIRHNFSCYINKRETPKTCLTNHKGFISHHITSLVINSLGGRHTHTHTHTHTCILTSRTKAISRNQLRTGPRPAHAWLKISVYMINIVKISTLSKYKVEMLSICPHFWLIMLITWLFLHQLTPDLLTTMPSYIFQH